MVDDNDKIHEKIGLKVMLERRKRKLSQEELAELADLNKTSLGAIERGTSVPTINTLYRIAKALNIELAELVDITKMYL